jgi:subtilisin
MKRLIAILGMVAMLSPAVAMAGQEIIPNGVTRIGAKPTQSDIVALDFSDVGVAVVDTGIDPNIADLNVVGGVDCSAATGGYIAERAETPGSQRSIWQEDPDAEKREAEAAKSSSTGSITVNTAPLVPEIGADGIFSLYGYSFRIQTIGTDPAEIGGRNSAAQGYEDGNGHGTHVSGIIGAAQDGQGLIGTAPNVRLYSVRVLDGSGGGSLDNVVCGLDWVAANAESENISVVNMSLGMDTGQKVMDMIEPCDSSEDGLPNFVVKSGLMKDEFHEAICDVVDAGVTVVVAAGNGWGDSATTIPAAYPEVIAVSNFADFDGLPGGRALPDANACPDMGGNDDQIWSHLNGSPALGYGSYGGEAVDIAAPGVCVLSTFPGGMAALTGTSMASPHVAGTVARIVAEGNATTVAAVRARLIDDAEVQTEGFRDQDEWLEPIVHVGS